MPIDVDQSRTAALAVIQTLADHGHQAVLAGGCVRDALLGITPKDHDVATDAKPEQVQALFKTTQMVGKHFGVALVKPFKGAPWIEVATFRTDGCYSDGRRPDTVSYTTADHDAQRRDFTINGLFAKPHPDDPTLDEVIDYVGGQADLQHQQLRAIGNPDARFNEDHLRLLRAIRFATHLHFTIEPATWQAIITHAPKLAQIARERIGDEVRRSLQQPAPYAVADHYERSQLAAVILKTESNLPALPKARLHNLAVTATYPTRLLAWLLDRNTRLNADHLQQALNLTNDEKNALIKLPKLCQQFQNWPALSIAGQKRLLANPLADQACLLLAADTNTAPLAAQIKTQADILTHDGIGIAPPPLLQGGDLIQAGHKPGPTFKPLLDTAYDLQLIGEITNRDQALAWLAGQNN